MKTEFSVPSSDGIHTLAGVVYLPVGEARGYFHIVHGMTEHIGRYDRIMTDLAHEGYIVFGYDNLGHGKTAKDDSELGFIAKKNGDDHLAKDVKAFSDAVKARYAPEYGTELPYYLMGHSMGSFITRMATVKYVSPDKYICMGTGGKNPAAGAGLFLIAIIKTLFGAKHYSKFVDKLAFGSFNKRCGCTPEDPSPWLTCDEEQRRKCYADKYCTFRFKISAMGDLIRLMRNSNKKSWYKAVKKDMPILLVAGEDDPVGNYGKGIKEILSQLKKQGCNADMKLYGGARHEILNDFTYGEVKADILAFLD